MLSAAAPLPPKPPLLLLLLLLAVSLSRARGLMSCVAFRFEADPGGPERPRSAGEASGEPPRDGRRPTAAALGSELLGGARGGGTAREWSAASAAAEAIEIPERF
jgi:hypothetical protein